MRTLNSQREEQLKGCSGTRRIKIPKGITDPVAVRAYVNNSWSEKPRALEDGQDYAASRKRKNGQ